MGCSTSKEDEIHKFQTFCEEHNIPFKSFKNQIAFLKQRNYNIVQIIGTNVGDYVIQAKNKDN